ncbi:hypothetical protein [Jeotgalicoccus sp. FSL K6-3177]|uniref:hypothetical protein n=1 Tax=Jeotgalicoccus sp. FSL K6-3177 TaxID=2921494 RepID=UPI0030FD3D1D
MTDKKTQAEKEAQDVWTRNQEYGGVGEAHDPENVVVEEGAEDCFCGFAADEEVDVEKQLDDEFDEMERGGNE